jgi:hypothetical protein
MSEASISFVVSFRPAKHKCPRLLNHRPGKVSLQSGRRRLPVPNLNSNNTEKLTPEQTSAPVGLSLGKQEGSRVLQTSHRLGNLFYVAFITLASCRYRGLPTRAPRSVRSDP